ncbi:hypothetical protein AV530_013001 [Patagioenas fasciata monilis]|uniref:Uncharacterized protein n=1 Tax=Patagioenas fasciata monilis TaxID=372326 RepID=A0A1V4J9X8_PATFA|nr:hypothetical protein AV530_013001 [Patagioenas fasciata monilis]
MGKAKYNIVRRASSLLLPLNQQNQEAAAGYCKSRSLNGEREQPCHDDAALTLGNSPGDGYKEGHARAAHGQGRWLFQLLIHLSVTTSVLIKDTMRLWYASVISLFCPQTGE